MNIVISLHLIDAYRHKRKSKRTTKEWANKLGWRRIKGIPLDYSSNFMIHHINCMWLDSPAAHVLRNHHCTDILKSLHIEHFSVYWLLILWYCDRKAFVNKITFISLPLRSFIVALHHFKSPVWLHVNGTFSHTGTCTWYVKRYSKVVRYKYSFDQI